MYKAVNGCLGVSPPASSAAAELSSPMPESDSEDDEEEPDEGVDDDEEGDDDGDRGDGDDDEPVVFSCLRYVSKPTGNASSSSSRLDDRSRDCPSASSAWSPSISSACGAPSLSPSSSLTYSCSCTAAGLACGMISLRSGNELGTVLSPSGSSSTAALLPSSEYRKDVCSFSASSLSVELVSRVANAGTLRRRRDEGSKRGRQNECRQCIDWAHEKRYEDKSG
jgi:hypothetical protein